MKQKIKKNILSRHHHHDPSNAEVIKQCQNGFAFRNISVSEMKHFQKTLHLQTGRNAQQQKNLTLMERLLGQLEEIPAYKDALKLWCKKNQIKMRFLICVTLSKCKKIYGRLSQMPSPSSIQPKQRWLDNQHKLFHFVLLAISTIHSTKIQDFSQEQWSYLQQIFPGRNRTLLQYEAISFITKNEALKKKWETKQDQILTQIVNQCQIDSLQWNQIAIGLFIRSEKRYFRSSKQCRQRWLNHLDDSIKHQEWTVEEDQKLISCVLQSGKKWSLIMRSFGNKRTEHMIKNRYISLIHKCSKVHPMIRDEDKVLKKLAIDMNSQLSPEKMQKLNEPKRLRYHRNDEDEESQENFESEKHQECLKKEQISENLEILPKIEPQQIMVDQQEYREHIEHPFYHHSGCSPTITLPREHFSSQNHMPGYDQMLRANPAFNLMAPQPQPLLGCNNFANIHPSFNYYMYYFQSLNQSQIPNYGQLL